MKYLDRSMLDSFIVYICIEGNATVSIDGGKEELAAGELVLIPAEACEVAIEGNAQLMEVYIGK